MRRSSDSRLVRAVLGAYAVAALASCSGNRMIGPGDDNSLRSSQSEIATAARSATSQTAAGDIRDSGNTIATSTTAISQGVTDALIARLGFYGLVAGICYMTIDAMKDLLIARWTARMARAGHDKRPNSV